MEKINTKRHRITTTENFIARAMGIHGDRYNYSRSVYRGYHVRIEILCPLHGYFEQIASSHLQGSGCRACQYKFLSVQFSMSLDQFVNRANEVHCSRYDYSKVIYKNNRTKIKIICKRHGEFAQSPDDHLSGKGCAKCKFEHLSQVHRKDQRQFVSEAKVIHGSRYCYNNVKYINGKEKVSITCPEHGDFQVQPAAHLRGHGCRKCSNNVSRACDAWIDSLGIPCLRREWKIPGTRFKADGYDPTSNTIYEFLGDFWHGNPTRYPPDELNKPLKCTFRQLYVKTVQRSARLRDMGYQVIEMWESDWYSLPKIRSP